MSSNTTLVGKWGEAQVGKWLTKHGYRLLAAGFRCRMGEIDLIAQKGDVLAFVEVKLRKNDHFSAAMEQVTLPKQRRIRITAEYFLSQHSEYASYQCRFDVAEVYAPDGIETKRPKLNYIEQAFW